MTTSGDTPDWRLLPHNPAQFFGLAEGFDRRELKRRYNALIRRYKPEKFSQEFQRIRAAFETLDSSLRYGQACGPVVEPSEAYCWRTDEPEVAPVDAASSRSGRTEPAGNVPATPAPLHERVRRQSPAAIYQELIAKAEKSAFDFYALAVLSDVVDRQDGLQFARWLLRGLKEHRNEPGIFRLLHEYIRGPLPDGAAEKLLVPCSRIFTEDLFFPLTEPLWQALLRSYDFPRFVTLLEQCESNLRGLHIDGRIAFYLQLLKAASWVADDTWINTTSEFIEENFERIPPCLDYDVELVIVLRDYIRQRAQFAHGHPLRRQMDQALRDYFTKEQAAGDRSVLECQILITRDVTNLVDAFAGMDMSVFETFYRLWSWVSFDVADRHAEPPQPTAEDHVWQSRTRMLLEQISQQTAQSRLGSTWTVASVVYRCLQILCYFVAPIFLGLAFALVSIALLPDHHQDSIAVMAGVGICIAGLALGHWLQKQLTSRFWIPYCTKMAGRCYHRIWQRELLNFLARSHVPFHSLLNFLSAEASNGIPRSVWIEYHAQQDGALAIYSTAQRFLV